jgi:hypothetical protein
MTDELKELLVIFSDDELLWAAMSVLKLGSR